MGHDEDHGPLSTVSKRDDRLEETVDKRIASGRHSRREWASMAWQCTGLCWTVRCATSISALRLISRGNHRESISRVLVQNEARFARSRAIVATFIYLLAIYCRGHLGTQRPYCRPTGRSTDCTSYSRKRDLNGKSFRILYISKRIGGFIFSDYRSLLTVYSQLQAK